MAKKKNPKKKAAKKAAPRKDGTSIDDIMGLHQLQEGGEAFLQRQNEEAILQQAALGVLKKYHGGSQEAAEIAFNDKDGMKKVDEARKDLLNRAIDVFYENREDFLKGVSDKVYVEPLDNGLFSKFVQGDDNKSKAYKSYTDARDKLARVQDGDQSALDEIIKSETERIEKSVRDSYEENKDDIAVKGQSDEKREENIKYIVQAYVAQLKSGLARQKIQEQFSDAKKKYNEAFGNNKAKAGFARKLLGEYSPKDDKDKKEVYGLAIKLKAQDGKAS
jgi:hypothetical protein